VTYPVTYIRLVARQLRLDDAGIERLLRGTTLSPADLRDLERRISETETRIVLGNVLAIAARPGFGLEVGRRLSIAAHGALGQLLATSPNLAEAWASLERFHALRVPLVQLRCSEVDDSYVIALDAGETPDAVRMFLLEAMAVSVQRGIELLRGTRLDDASWRFAFPAPAHVEHYERQLHGVLAFGAVSNELRVPLATMYEPNPFADPHAWELALRRCEALALEHDADRTVDWRTRVTHLLQRHPGQLWTLDEIAAHVHVSKRTLMRYLDAEGTSFRALVDAELERQAKIELLAPSSTVDSVAATLGYHDAASFRRAFRRWCGESPSGFVARRSRDG